jgi:hypothetical protein
MIACRPIRSEIYHRLTAVAQRVWVGFFAVIAQGCIAFPVPQFPSDHETYISEESTGLIQAEVTLREEVRQHFGHPDYRFADDSRWVFKANSHRAGKLRICGAIADPTADLDELLEGRAGEAGCTSKTQKRVITYLEINFDQNAVVNDYLMSTVKPGGCAKSNICRDQDGVVYFRGGDGRSLVPQSISSPTGDPTWVVKEAIGFAEAGETTKEEVQDNLGSPFEKYSRGEWWVFRTSRQTDQWIFWACASGICDETAEFGGKASDYFLLLRFDVDDVLQWVSVVHDNKPCNKDGAVCYQDYQIQIIRNAGTLLLDDPGFCTVIVYGRTPAKRSPRVWLEIDSGGAPAGLLTDTNFLSARLADGSYEISVSSSLVDEIRKSLVVQCASGTTHILRLLYEKAGSVIFTPVEAELGREEIRGRTLGLLRDWQ